MQASTAPVAASVHPRRELKELINDSAEGIEGRAANESGVKNGGQVRARMFPTVNDALGRIDEPTGTMVGESPFKPYHTVT